VIYKHVSEPFHFVVDSVHLWNTQVVFSI